jgi:hypothetical protein
MPDWLKSDESIIGAAIVSVLAIVRAGAAVIESRAKRLVKRRSLADENQRLRGRVAELEQQLTELGRDHGLTAASLSAVQDERDRLRDSRPTPRGVERVRQ